MLSILIKKLYETELVISNYFEKSVYHHEVFKADQTIRSSVFSESYTFEYDHVNVELSKYPYQENSFDTVLFCEVLEHIIEDLFCCFSKIFSILKPGR